MNVVELHAFGGPEQLTLVQRPVPAVGAGQVRILVKAVGVNFSDVLMRQDRYAATPELPAVLGSEIAGIVDEVGPGVTDIAVGDRVVAALFATGNHIGGYAEQVVTQAEWVAHVPDAVSFEAAAASLVTGLTARYLLDRSPVHGKTVLITAAAGGVGSMLVQMAKAEGAARVVAAAGGDEKCAFAISLGADAAFDYIKDDWSAQLARTLGDAALDIVFESSGGQITRDAFSQLGASAELVIYGALNLHDFQLGVPQLGQMIFRNQSVTGFALGPLLTPADFRQQAARLYDVIAAGGISLAIAGSYPLAEVAQAHKLIEMRATKGKIVLMV